MPAAMSLARRARAAWPLLVVAAAGLPSLSAGFFTDDRRMLVESRLVGPEHLPDLWLRDAMYVVDEGRFARTSALDTYRPLTIATFVIQHAAAGVRPWSYHLVNLILHLGVCALALAWLRRAVSAPAAAAGVVLFGVHPAMAEAWVWVNGRSDPIAALFVLAALLLLERGRHAFAAVALLCGCLAKETALAALPILALRPCWPSEGEGVPALRLRPAAALAWLGGAAAAYLALRAAALGGLRVAQGAAHGAAALGAWPLLLADGAAELIAPRHLAVRVLADDYAAAPAWASWACGAAVAAAAAIAWRARCRLPALAWGLAGYLVLMSPVALALVLRWHGQGRYLYLPALLLLPGALDGARRLLAPASPRVRAAVAAAVAVAFAAGLQAVIAAYRDEETMWRAAAGQAPDRAYGWGNLGAALGRRGDLAGAVATLGRARAIDPDDARWIHNLAVARFRQGDARACVELNEHGQRLHPRDPEFRYGAAVCRLRLRDLPGAADDVRRGLAADPHDRRLRALARDLGLIPHRPQPPAGR